MPASVSSGIQSSKYRELGRCVGDQFDYRSAFNARKPTKDSCRSGRTALVFVLREQRSAGGVRWVRATPSRERDTGSNRQQAISWPGGRKGRSLSGREAPKVLRVIASVE